MADQPTVIEVLADLADEYPGQFSKMNPQKTLERWCRHFARVPNKTLRLAADHHVAHGSGYFPKIAEILNCIHAIEENNNQPIDNNPAPLKNQTYWRAMHLVGERLRGSIDDRQLETSKAYLWWAGRQETVQP
jgi:hypothetical protein